MPGIEEEAIRPKSLQGDTPGLDGPLRTDMGAFEAPLLGLVDHAIQGPVVLPRDGSDAVAFLPLDTRSGLWARAPRPPVIDAQSDPDN